MITFSDLNSDVQNRVLSSFFETLISARRLNSHLRNITARSFYDQLYNLPFSQREIIRYLDMLPTNITMFIWDYKHDKSPVRLPLIINEVGLRVFKINSMTGLNYDIDREYTSRLVTQLIMKFRDESFVCDKNEIILLMDRCEFDLITNYWILRMRKCDDIVAGSSRQKILALLDNHYNTTDKNNYLSMLSLNVYLRLNAEKLSVCPGAELFPEYAMRMDNKLYIYEVQDVSGCRVPLTHEYVIITAKQVNHDLYIKLRESINKLE